MTDQPETYKGAAEQDFEITDEERAAILCNARDYLWGSGTADQLLLAADALRKQTARAMKAEFEVSNHCITAERVNEGVRAYRTNFDDNDPRHDWTPEQWAEAADRELGSVSV